MEDVESGNPFPEFTEAERAVLLGLPDETRKFSILKRIELEAQGEATNLLEKLERGLRETEHSQEASLLPYTDCFLILDSGLSPDEEWSAFDEAMNPAMPPVEELPSTEWMNASIRYQARTLILKKLGFTLPLTLPSTETGWGTVEEEGRQAFYLRAPNKDNVCLVRSSGKKDDKNRSLFVETLAYAPTVEALEQFLREEQEKPSVVSSSPR